MVHPKRRNNFTALGLISKLIYTGVESLAADHMKLSLGKGDLYE